MSGDFRKDADWVTSWATGLTGPWRHHAGAYNDGFRESSLRQVLPLNSAANAVRVRFSNQFGTRPLGIDEVYVGVQVDGACVRGNVPLLFSGDKKTVIPPGGVWLSDPTEIEIKYGENLTVSSFFDWDTPEVTAGNSGATTYVASGNETSSASDSGYEETKYVRGYTRGSYFIANVDVLNPGARRTIVTIGDSLTAGERASWPGVMARRLGSTNPEFAVANVGIGGNRLLTSTGGPFGLAGIRRLQDDVLALPSVDIVIAMWVNDIGLRYLSPFDLLPGLESIKLPYEYFGATTIGVGDLIHGYRQFIRQAHARGVSVILGTTTPFHGNPISGRAGNDEVRMALNQWITTSGEPDGVIDFASAVGEGSPAILRSELHIGDSLHFNEAGHAILGKIAAEAVADFVRGRPG